MLIDDNFSSCYSRCRYLRKETGYFSPKTKSFHEGFQMNWDWYHFHHVCVQRGSEGVYTGLTNFVNDWKEANAGNNSNWYISENDWNGPKLRNPTINDFWHSQVGLYEAKRMDPSTVGKISVLEGGTLFFNCETPLSFERYKQFDWMSKLGVFYELANYFHKNIKNNEQLFKFPWTYPFHHILMNRCSDPAAFEWQLGAQFFDLVKEKMELANITKEGYTNFFRDEAKDNSNAFICVDDLYFSVRVQNFISNYDHQVDFRKDSHRLFGVPRERPSTPEISVEVPVWVRVPFCPKQIASRTYPARIVFVKYKGNMESGVIHNADDVIRLLQSLTSLNVDVVTVSPAKSFATAVTNVFDSADIIVAPFGTLSLLGVFAKWPFTKIYVELTPYMHNPVFYRSYRRLNFADYIVSTGHYTAGDDKKACPIHVIRDFNRLDCNISRHSFPKRSTQERFLCPWEMEKAFKCEMEVNLKQLRAQLIESLRHMCKNGTEWTELQEHKPITISAAAAASTHRKYDPKHKFNKWNVFNAKKPRRMELDVNGLKYPGSYTFTYENHSLYEKAMNLTYGNKLPPFKYYLTVLATFKNEGKILEEWLEHHIAHGVEHFYLVNDHSTDNCMSLLAPYLENGIVTMFNAPSVASQFRQVALYRNSIVRIMATNESQWVAIIDLDEFLYSPKEVDIKNILRQHEDLSLVGLNWVWFGANNYAKQPGSVIQSFTTRADYDASKYPEFIKRYKMINPITMSPSNAWQKYILNLQYKVVDVDVHGANIEGTIDNLSYLRYPDDPPLLLNHYAVQSKENFMAKGEKKDINNFRDANLYSEEWFDILSMDDVVDTRLAEQNKANSIAMRFVRDEDNTLQTLSKSKKGETSISSSSDSNDSSDKSSSSDTSNRSSPETTTSSSPSASLSEGSSITSLNFTSGGENSTNSSEISEADSGAPPDAGMGGNTSSFEDTGSSLATPAPSQKQIKNSEAAAAVGDAPATGGLFSAEEMAANGGVSDGGAGGTGTDGATSGFMSGRRQRKMRKR